LYLCARSVAWSIRIIYRYRLRAASGCTCGTRGINSDSDLSFRFNTASVTPGWPATDSYGIKNYGDYRIFVYFSEWQITAGVAGSETLEKMLRGTAAARLADYV
jgi:hypothetical protein